MSQTNEKFGEAVEAVIDGNAARLSALLRHHPDLVHARSPKPHAATLLHYVAANGVEDELQRTPANAVEICELLLAAGSDPDSVANTYGGGPNETALCLLVSSWHPFERGVQSDLVRALATGGASLNGTRDDGAPLGTALLFGYTSAAETLASLGARVDNLFFAAGLGDEARVREFFADDGSLRAGALGTYAPPVAKGLASEPHEIVQEAFHFAVTHGRVPVAEFLLARGADVNGRTTGQHCELPLMQVLFVRELELVPFLLKRGADPSLRDNKRKQTPLESARDSGPADLVELLESA